MVEVIYFDAFSIDISLSLSLFINFFFILGAFLVTYSIAMIFCGIPMFYQEVAIGQFLGSGGMTFVGQLVPIFKGVGYATMTIVFMLDVYYCIIIAWTIFYIVNTFVVLPDLPWSNCGKFKFYSIINLSIINSYYIHNIHRVNSRVKGRFFFFVFEM